MTLQGDTIAAIATAPGRGGVAIVRVSGPEAFDIAQTLTRRAVVPGRIAFARFFGPGEERRLLDEGVVLAFKHPHSYTGEDVVEFQCHGGTVTPRRILDACFAAGARLAQRGEFSFRAFIHGKMSLEAAEGVIELVDAKTDRAADRALEHLQGTREKRHRALYETALEISASIEHVLDFDENELPPDYLVRLRQRVEALRQDLSAALAQLRVGRFLRDGAHVVLAGPPNAGKSSLMNALLGEERVLVSSTPGTTRDSVESWIDVDGWPVILTDTAGLRATDDAIEAAGVSRARDIIQSADLVLALDCEIPGAIRIHAKCDLDASPCESCLAVSAKTGAGLEALRHCIAAQLERKACEPDESLDATEQTRACLTEVRRCLDVALGEGVELAVVANAVRLCAEKLGVLVGAVYTEDLLDAVFSRFCVGK